MQYRTLGNTGDKVSILGYGCMRFPRKSGRIDEPRVQRQISSAIERGVNYFDTAFGYPGSEAALGRALESAGTRGKVFIATKLPHFLMHAPKDLENNLNTSLERLRTDHVDYYLMHNFTSLHAWERLKALGAEEFLERMKRCGKVRHIGFSYHGNRAEFPQIVDSYPWDFCQIQYNIMDEDFQAGTSGMQYAFQKGLGVIAMEPLRGGLLAGKVPDAVQAVWDKAEVKRSPAEWALRWVWNHPEIATLLSGMNEESQIDENIRAASEALPGAMTEAELRLVEEAKSVYNQKMKVGCTGCGYCMPCPSGVNIPTCFKFYNDMYLFDDKSFKAKYTFMQLGLDGAGPSFASNCTQCGKCEKRCPQGLPIRQHLKEVSSAMEPFYVRPAACMAKWYINRRKRNGAK